MAGIVVSLLGACLASALGGCGQTQVYEAVLRGDASPRSASRPTELYLGAQRPAWRFYDVGLVQAVGFGDDATAEDVTNALLVRGRQLGCDAVLKVSIDVGASLAHSYGVCVRATRTANVQGAPSAPAATPAPPSASEAATPPSPSPL